MGEAKTIYLLRHGAVDASWNGRYLGASDASLSEVGRFEMQKAGAAFRPLFASLDQVWVSPLKRCRESLAALNLSGDAEVIDELVEINFGLYEGCTFDEIAQKDRHFVAEWAAGSPKLAFPAGESLGEFYRRIDHLKLRLFKDDFKNILLLTHAGVIRHLMVNLLGVPYRHHLALQVDRAALSCLYLEGELGVLQFLNLKGANCDG